MSTSANTPESTAMPPIILDDTKTFGELAHIGPTYVARLCKSGKIPAAKIGKSWRINRYEALQTMGLLNDVPSTAD